MKRNLQLALYLLLFAARVATAQAPPMQDPKADLLKAELFIAIRDRNPDAVKTLLARGADPHGRNWLDFTPLMWASIRGTQPIVDTLLTHGAQLDDSSIYGSALTFAVIGRNEKLALYLLDRGAMPEPSRIDGATPLMLAAATGYSNLVDRLLEKRSDLNKRDADGATALIYAARLGQTPIMKRLLDAGTDVDAADSHGRTALMYASANGRSQSVSLLLTRHPAIDKKDRGGATALLLAARYSGHPAIIRSLLRAGADPSAQDRYGKTPLSLTVSRGFSDAASVLRGAGTRSSVQEVAAVAAEAESDVPSPSRAIERSLPTLQIGMKGFAKNAECSSCHHQGLGLMTLGLAQQRGFAVDKELVGSYLMNMAKDGQAGAPAVHQALSDPNVGKTIQAVDIGDFCIGSGYLIGSLIAYHVPSNPGLEELAVFQARQQASDGHWGYGIDREPIQSSNFTTTALSLRILRSYTPKSSAEEFTKRYEHAKQWLMTTPAPNVEDKASRLLGLKWAGASKEEMQKPLRELLAAQRSDGGWAQLTSMPSDAYATGLTLYALRVGGEMAASDPAYQRGVQYLLRTQDEDGSWYVNKRTTPANVYFDAGFPHGESQFISFGATCWATMALLQDAEPSRAARR